MRRWAALRPLVGWLLALAGALALLLAWWGVSGTSLPAKQMPYVVSGGLTGVSLLVLAAAWFATQDIRSRLAGLDAVERRVEELYQLLTAEPGAPSGELVAVPAGRSYHRPLCRLVQGKDSVVAVTQVQIRDRGLSACRLCDPVPA